MINRTNLASSPAVPPTRTDSRPLNQRKLSVQLRIGELRKALAAAERAAAEIDIEAEMGAEHAAR